MGTMVSKVQPSAAVVRTVTMAGPEGPGLHQYDLDVRLRRRQGRRTSPPPHPAIQSQASASGLLQATKVPEQMLEGVIVRSDGTALDAEASQGTKPGVDTLLGCESAEVDDLALTRLGVLDLHETQAGSAASRRSCTRKHPRDADATGWPTARVVPLRHEVREHTDHRTTLEVSAHLRERSGEVCALSVG